MQIGHLQSIKYVLLVLEMHSFVMTYEIYKLKSNVYKTLFHFPASARLSLLWKDLAGMSPCFLSFS